jgi:excisionase family DNA binding protein
VPQIRADVRDCGYDPTVDRRDPPVDAARQDSDWISIGPAARLLGVDPATLRRWATAGRVDAFTTPGGHRRFLRAAVEQLRDERAAGGPSLASSRSLIAAAYRRHYRGSRLPLPRPWLAGLGAEDRDGLRERGRRMVDAILVHLDASDSAVRGRSLRAALRLGREYGAEARRLDLALAEAIAGFVGSRRLLMAEIATLAGARHLAPADTARLLVRAAGLLDDILLALVDEHERPRGADPTARPGPRGSAAG